MLSRQAKKEREYFPRQKNTMSADPWLARTEHVTNSSISAAAVAELEEDSDKR